MRKPVLILALLSLPAFLEVAVQHAVPAASSPSPPAPGQSPPPNPAPPPVAGAQAPVDTKPVVVVIDPGHGGTDAGARGASGILEKDVVWTMAVQLRAALERQGMRAVLTREAAANPGFDDRATLANSYRGAVLIALHASSVGSPGTVRAYYDAVAPLAFRPLAGAAGSEENAAPRSSLVRWEEAQQPHISASKRLAEMIQSRLRERFSGSPAAASSATLRDLRSVAGPAVAVEVASVSVADKKALDQMIPGVAEAIARAIAAFREAESAAGSL